MKDNDDVSGAVAYALYKKQKVQYIQDFCDKNGRNPTDDEMKAFHSAVSVQEAIDGYEQRAENILNAIIRESVIQALDTYHEEVESETRNSVLMEKIEKNASVAVSIKNGIIGGLASTIFIALLIWSLEKAPTDLMNGKRTTDTVQTDKH